MAAGTDRAELLECASPLALWGERRESGRGLPQSKTLSATQPPIPFSWLVECQLGGP
jgi:hypothetical protein